MQEKCCKFKFHFPLQTFLYRVSAMNPIVSYIRSNTFERPTLVLDVDQVEENYHRLKAGMPAAHIHYAVKANPHPDILARLVTLGCRFDAASIGEIDLCLAAGADPAHISFGNTVKRVQDIRDAYARGINLFAADASEELAKIAKYAPGSNVFIRVLMRSTEAEWPLSRKFGCSSSMVIPLMHEAAAMELNPVGLSFHVGSQTRHPHMWYDSLDSVAAVWHNALEEGFDLSLLNIGGGFPTYYGVDVTELEEYGATVLEAVQERFGDVEYIMAEPGRGLVGNAGCIAAEALLVERLPSKQNVASSNLVFRSKYFLWKGNGLCYGDLTGFRCCPVYCRQAGSARLSCGMRTSPRVSMQIKTKPE